MWSFTSNLLLQSGYSRYEISNYSLPGFECKHNLDTWFGGTYLGLGPTASSFDGKIRWTQPKLNEWLKDEKPEIDSLSTRKRTMEIFIMGLRTTHGWIAEKQDNEYILFTSQFTHNLSLKIADWEIINKKLFSLHKAGLLKIKNINSSKTQIFPTEKGLLFWNEVAMELI
jgi:oxygen-independent coproporphyrinogen III oxidase